jgi:hypothetical protein
VTDGARGASLIVFVPVVDRVHRVSLRTITMPIQSQGIITRDNVSFEVSGSPRTWSPGYVHPAAGRPHVGVARKLDGRLCRTMGMTSRAAPALFMAQVAAQAALVAPVPVLPDIAHDFSVSVATAGQLRTVSGVAAVMAALAAGRVARRIGVERLLLVGRPRCGGQCRGAVVRRPRLCRDPGVRRRAGRARGECRRVGGAHGDDRDSHHRGYGL